MTGRSTSVPESGFTLLEMLVTLVMVSLAVTILAESLFQLNRLEGLLAGGQLQAQTEVVRTEWVRQSIGSLQSGDSAGRSRFTGSRRTLEGVTGNPLSPRGGGFGPLQLYLTYEAKANETVLWSVDPNGGAAAPVALLRWPNNTGEWVYFDRDGKAHDSWPPALGEQRRLPAAVALMSHPAKAPVILIEVLADNNPMPSRPEYEAM